MAEINLAPTTRIRIIDHALAILANHNAKISKMLSSGELQMSRELQVQSRQNAEEKNRLRKIHTKLKSLVATVEGVEDTTEDLVVASFNDLIASALPEYQMHTGASISGPSFVCRRCSKDELALTIMHTDALRAQSDLEALDELIFTTEMDVPRGPNRGKLFFMTAPAEADDLIGTQDKTDAQQDGATQIALSIFIGT